MKKIKQNWVTLLVIFLCVGGIFWWIKSAQLPIPEAEKNKPVDQLLTTDWVMGNSNAPIKVLEYSDFQCPACRQYSGIGEQLVQQLGDKVGFAYRNFPLRQIHKYADLSAQAAEAAGKQGKFWEMSAILFDKQDEWSTSNQPLILFNGYAKQIGVNTDQFIKEIDKQDIKALIEADYLSGLVAKVNATPTFYINGQKINNLAGPDDLIARIELTLQEATASAK